MLRATISYFRRPGFGELAGKNHAQKPLIGYASGALYADGAHRFLAANPENHNAI